MELGTLSLSQLPVRQRILLAGLLWLVTGYLCYLYLIRDPRDEVTRLEAGVQILENEVAQARVVELRLAEFKSELDLQRKQLEDFREKLPSTKETSDLMSRIQELAVENDLNLTTFTPQPTERRDFYVDWPIRMTLEGSYHNLASFFEKIGKMNRLINIGEVSVRAMENTTVRDRTIGATCTATTFVYLEETGA